METSALSNDRCLLSKKRTRPLGDATNNFNTSKYKGVVQNQNGHWGAQIYINHKRIWIGTFRSADEAARVYDSVSLKLGKFDGDSHRNIVCSDSIAHEQKFQEGKTTEDVLNMIKDGSYTHEFRDFLKNRSQTGSAKQSGEVKERTRTLLFQKELTPSDVGKLNRLVIPKKCAVTYLPSIRDVDDVEVVVYDRAMKQWKFRYCYWRSSQSFVFTRGWIGFVKDKKLKEKDVVVFYTCNVKTLEGTSKKYLMTDVHHASKNGFVGTEKVHVHESVYPVEMKPGNVIRSKLRDEETKSKENKGGFMLFGVLIQ